MASGAKPILGRSRWVRSPPTRFGWRGAIVYEVTEPEAAAPAVEAAARIAFNGNLTAAVLLSQRMLGAKLFKD